MEVTFSSPATSDSRRLAPSFEVDDGGILLQEPYQTEAYAKDENHTHEAQNRLISITYLSPKKNQRSIVQSDVHHGPSSDERRLERGSSMEAIGILKSNDEQLKKPPTFQKSITVPQLEALYPLMPEEEAKQNAVTTKDDASATDDACGNFTETVGVILSFIITLVHYDMG